MDDQEFSEILGAVRTFVREQVVPREDEIEANDEVPADLRAAAADMGLFGYALPVEFGGLGLTMSEDVRLAMECAYSTPAFRSMFGTNNGLAGQAIVRHGTDAQKDHYLTGLASGKLIGSFALTESEAGSDPSGMRARARRDGDTYVINGVKRFITNAPWADFFITFARTGTEEFGTQGVSTFIVDRSTPGLTIGPRDKKMGQAGAWTAEVFYDDAVVPASALPGKEGNGFRAAMQSVGRGRIGVAALCVGMAQRLVDESVRHAQVTKQGGKPISRFQLVQGMLAESQTELMAARELVLATARRYDTGEDTKLGPSCAKLFASEMVDRVADRAVQIHGGMGYMRSVPVERFYRDARLFRIYEGTSEIQKVIIARQLLA